MSAMGRMAVRLEPPGGPPFLWLVDDPASIPRTDASIRACPSLYPSIEAYARSEGITGLVRIRETLEVPEHDFLVFEISYDFSGLGHNYLVGAAVGDHVGWLEGPCEVGFIGDSSCPGELNEGAFRPRPDERFLWSEEFLDRLEALSWEGKWVRHLLSDPSLPLPALESLVRRGGFDAELVQHPRVQKQADWLLEILARQGRGGALESAAFEALWQQGVALVRDPETPKSLLLRFAQRVQRGTSQDTLAAGIGRALIAHPATGHDPEVLVHLAQVPPSVDTDIFRTAGRRLLDDRSVTASGLDQAVANMAADPSLAERLLRDPRVLNDTRSLTYLARTPWAGWSVAERTRALIRQLRRAGVIHWYQSQPSFSLGPWSGEQAMEALVYAKPLRRVIEELDPIFMHRLPRTELEQYVCWFATSKDLNEYELVLIAENAVYATSTRVASCLLESPLARDSERVLRILAGMIDVNHDPRFPEEGAPSIADIRNRAESLLQGN